MRRRRRLLSRRPRRRVVGYVQRLQRLTSLRPLLCPLLRLSMIEGVHLRTAMGSSNNVGERNRVREVQQQRERKRGGEGEGEIEVPSMTTYASFLARGLRNRRREKGRAIGRRRRGTASRPQSLLRIERAISCFGGFLQVFSSVNARVRFDNEEQYASPLCRPGVEE